MVCNVFFQVDVSMAFPTGIDLSTFQSDYLESSDWHIQNATAEKKILPSVNDTPNYGVLSFEINMKRKLVFSSYILTLPCVFLACLTLVVFWLPPDRPDRTALGEAKCLFLVHKQLFISTCILDWMSQLYMYIIRGLLSNMNMHPKLQIKPSCEWNPGDQDT